MTEDDRKAMADKITEACRHLDGFCHIYAVPQDVQPLVLKFMADVAAEFAVDYREVMDLDDAQIRELSRVRYVSAMLDMAKCLEQTAEQVMEEDRDGREG